MFFLLLGQINLNDKFDSLKENMSMYQQNINNNITWFYATVAIITAVLLVGLYFLVTESVKRGIEKGIKDANNNLMTIIQDEKELYFARGNAGALGNGVFIINGLVNFSAEKFVSLVVYKKISGEVVPYTINNIKDGTLTVKVDSQGLKDFDYNGTVVSDGLIYWNVIWLKNG